MLQILGLLKYLPLILTLIPIVEAIFKGATGTDKKNAVISLVVTISDQFGLKITAKDLENVAVLVDKIVAVFNKTGLFEKAVPNTSTAVTPEVIAAVVKAPVEANKERIDELLGKLEKDAAAARQ